MTIARKHRPAVATLAALLAALSGCSSTPRFNEHFGDAVRSNLSAQVLEPARAANTSPTLGIDGAAARATQERYERSFKDPASGRSQPLVGGGTQQ